MEQELYIRLLNYEYLTIDTSWNAQNVFSSYWRFYVNNDDGAAVVLENSRFKLRKNHVYFIPAWVRFSCHNVKTLKHFYVHFDIIGFDNPACRKIFCRPFDLGSIKLFNSLIKELTPLGCEGKTLCKTKSLIYHYFALLLNAVSPAQLSELFQSLDSRHRFNQVTNFIENHLSESLSNHQLARTAHLSESHFCRVFKEVFHQSPALYVLTRRIASAAEQLIFSSDSIESISSRSGFANRFHFSRNFSRIMGVSPAAYRKTSRV
jgi:AraC-like DNA-binding protein